MTKTFKDFDKQISKITNIDEIFSTRDEIKRSDLHPHEKDLLQYILAHKDI